MTKYVLQSPTDLCLTRLDVWKTSDEARPFLEEALQNRDCAGKLVVLPLNWADSMGLQLRTDVTIIAYQNEFGNGTSLFKMPSAISLDLNESLIGKWSSEKGLAFTVQNLQDVHEGLTGTTVKVATLSAPPVITGFNKTSAHGFAGDILGLMAETHGFKLRYFPSFDGKYGSQVNGSWNGFVRMLMENQVDLVGAYFAMTQERSEGILDHIPSWSLNMS